MHTENVCLKIGLGKQKKGKLLVGQESHLVIQIMSEKINLQMEIGYLSLADFWMTKEVRNVVA